MGKGRGWEPLVAAGPIVERLRQQIDGRAAYQRDRNVIRMDPMTSMRDIDLLNEDIESGVLEISDLTGAGSTVEFFVLGYDGFSAGEDWELG